MDERRMKLCRDGVFRPLQKSPPLNQAIKKLWSRIQKGDERQCWEWTGCKGTKRFHNYGHVRFQKKTWLVHRLVWFLENGEIPEGIEVCHSCDNPPCCNPSHLFLGNHQSNMKDAKEKGRMNCTRGCDRYNAVLKEKDIIQIRRRYIHMSRTNGGNALAREFGVHRTVINGIINGRYWKHV